VKLPPNIDELARVVRVQNVGKRRCLGFCITSSFVPVCLRIAKVYGRHVSGAKTWEKKTYRWLSARR
jgi:hypothetical protein